MRDEAEYKGDSRAVALGSRRCLAAEGVTALDDPALFAHEYAAEGGSRTLLEVGAGRALTAARGVEAVVGDVQALLFEDGSFDCAITNNARTMPEPWDLLP